MNICLVVSSYSESVAPGTPFSVHLAASAKASSGLQLLLMMTPDHDPGVGIVGLVGPARGGNKQPRHHPNQRETRPHDVTSHKFHLDCVRYLLNCPTKWAFCNSGSS